MQCIVIWKFCLFNVKVIVIILPALSLTIFCILPLKFPLKGMAMSAEWLVGPEFQRAIPFNSSCHFVSAVLVEWVSCNTVMSFFLVFRLLKNLVMVVKAVYINCKNLKFVGVKVMRVCVIHFCVYVSRVSNVEWLGLVPLGFSFLVSWLYISEYNVSMSIRFSVNFR